MNVACDYDVMGVRKAKGTTTVYAWVLIQGYSFDGGKNGFNNKK